MTVSGGNGSYTISSNTNPSVVSTSLSGGALTVSGVSAGGATINVCDTSNTCGMLSVTIAAANTSGLSFSQNNISVPAGTSQTVTISGGNGTYGISNVSNPTAVSAGMSGTGIIVFAAAAGTAAIKVCDTANTCGMLNVTIAASTVNRAVVFSVTNPTLAIGQSLNVGLSGAATSFFVLANANANIAQASMANSLTLSLAGMSAGTDSLTVCAIGGGGCNPLSVTVTGPANTTTTTATTTNTAVATTATTVAQIPATIAQPATVVANTTLLAEIQTIQNAITQVLAQVQSIQTQLGQLEAQVNAGSGSGVGANVSASTNIPPETSYNFTELLTAGSQDAEVTALQNRLTALGFYSGPVTGYYGALTEAAVVKYQTAHSIAATGYVGPSTRTALNAGN